MNCAKRQGFTLVELLVVITIIGMLMALLLPAVQAARETARRAQCLNSERNLSTALQIYESRREYFPGYMNYFGQSSDPASVYGSWIVAILPDLEQNQLWDLWTDQQRSIAQRQNNYITWELLTCASDVRDATAADRPALSYAVNCGIPDALDATYNQPYDGIGAAGGVFHNHCWNAPDLALSGHPIEVSISYISTHDGTSYTMLVTENLDTKTWGTVYNTAGPGVFSTTSAASAANLELDMGVAWDWAWEPDDGVDVITDPPNPNPPNINVRTDEGTIGYKRPSSRHPGGVNMAMADNSARFVADTLDYLIYQQIMAPWDEKAAKASYALDNANGIQPTPVIPNLRTSIFDPGDAF